MCGLARGPITCPYSLPAPLHSASTCRQGARLGQGPDLNPTLHTPQTDYFHLFICVAIVAIYGDDVIEQQLATDQMLLHFGNLAMHMNGELVLRKVRTGPAPALTQPRPHTKPHPIH